MLGGNYHQKGEFFTVSCSVMGGFGRLVKYGGREIINPKGMGHRGQRGQSNDMRPSPTPKKKKKKKKNYNDEHPF